MKLSIVVPCYNEADTIGIVIASIDKRFPNAEIIVVNDASTDATPYLLKEYKKFGFKIRILTNKQNKGHAYSLIRGLIHAKGDYILYIDADNQISIKDMYFNKDYDLISGYREHRQDRLFRKIISFILKLVIRIRHGYWIKDANCPFKLFKRESLEMLLYHLPNNSTVPSIDLEIYARSRLFKYNVLEIPIDHLPYIKERTGTLQSINIKSIKIFWEAFKEVWNL